MPEITEERVDAPAVTEPRSVTVRLSTTRRAQAPGIVRATVEGARRLGVPSSLATAIISRQGSNAHGGRWMEWEVTAR